MHSSPRSALVCVVVFLAAVVVACSKPSEPQRADTAGAQTAKLVLLTRDGCMNTDTLRKNLDVAIAQLGRPVPYDVVDQGTLAGTDPRRGYPTPTLLFANRDVLGLPEPKPPFPEPT